MENLSRQRDELQNQLCRLDDLIAAWTEKILLAIQNQRWFFFANNPNILLDGKTALVWANPNCFPFSKNGICYALNEVENLILQKNSECWGGLRVWQIPTPPELLQMIYDISFPFNLRGWRYVCVCCNGKFFGKDLSSANAMSGLVICDVYVLPCSYEFVPQNFRATPQEILNIFTQNNLIPIFNDAEINELYRKIFLDNPAPFDTAAIAKSPIKYFDAVSKMADVYLYVLQQNEASQSEAIDESLRITLKLNEKFIDNPKLTPEENLLLAERQKFLAQRLELKIDEPKRKILSVKAQAENFFTRLDEINAGSDSIRELAALQAEPRADFDLLTENLARIIKDAQNKINFFAAHKDLIASLVNFQAAWSDDYKTFKTRLHEEFSTACRNDKIDDKIFAAWYDDWQVKRFALEQRVLPLIEFALKGNIGESVERTLEILREYRNAVDKFYLHKRKDIYRECKLNDGSDLQEKCAIELKFHNLAEKFRHDLQEIIFSRYKIEERVFLLRWAEPLLNLPMDELINFISNRELDALSKEFLSRLSELRRQNLEKYLVDSKSFDEASRKREAEFNALIFRMREDLHKS